MSEKIEIKDGWTLKEAFEKCSDFALLTAFRNAESQLHIEREKMPDLGSPPSRLGLRHYDYLDLQEDYNRDVRRISRHLKPFKQALSETENALVKDFYQKMSTGRLVAWGRQGSRIAGWIEIPPDAWGGLFVNWDESILKESGKDEEIYTVRIFTPLMSPNAPARLDGLSFVEAFRNFVLNDPELLMLVDALRDEDGRLDLVGERQFVRGCYGEKDCALQVTYKGWDGLNNQLEDQDEKTLHRVAWRALGARITRLIRLLSVGDLVAMGEYVGTGEKRTVSSFRWSRDDVWIDFTRGDLFTRAIFDDQGLGSRFEDELEPLFRGLELALPEIDSANDLLKNSASIKSEEESPAFEHVKSLSSAKRECEEWIKSLPVAPRKRKKDVKEEAKQRFAGLSGRSFDLAWANCAPQDWKKRGRYKNETPHH